jgi:multidrug resistance efflux pump
MQRGALALGIAAVIVGGGVIAIVNERNDSSTPALAAIPQKIAAAAPGRLEGATETTALGSSASGVIEEILVKQGDHVTKGQLLARIECNDIISEISQHIADDAAATSVYERLKNGSRPEDIAVAEADLALAQARRTEAEAAYQRTSALLKSGTSSVALALTTERDSRMATAQVLAAQNRLTLLKLGPRVEDIAEAKAREESSKRSIEVSKARLAKCEIHSPVNGIVLHKYVSVGELVSVYNPQPLLSLAQTDRYRVRAEVDEKDVTRIHLGQPVSVVVDAASNRRLSGSVVELARSMGRRQILTTDAADKSDRDVMEVIVNLNGDASALPIGLRVSVIFENIP